MELEAVFGAVHVPDTVVLSVPPFVCVIPPAHLFITAILEDKGVTAPIIDAAVKDVGHVALANPAIIYPLNFVVLVDARVRVYMPDQVCIVLQAVLRQIM